VPFIEEKGLVVFISCHNSRGNNSNNCKGKRSTAAAAAGTQEESYSS